MTTYLDNASTRHPKPDAVWEAARDYLREVGASPGRGGYRAARRADEIVESARSGVARLFGETRAARIAFTANATHALNLAVRGSLEPGDHVVTTSIEHNSVLRPLEMLAQSGRNPYTVVEVGADGRHDLDLFADAVRPGTRLVVVNHASNVTGAVAPVTELAALARARGARVLLDASQTAGHLDLTGVDVDLIAFTGHKALGGPPGTGGLHVADPAALRPLLHGGTGLNSHSLLHPQALPAKFEAGTQNYVGIAGLGAAVAQLPAHDPAPLDGLTGYLLDRLRAVDGVTVHELAPDVPRVPVVSFTVRGLFPTEVSALLDERYGVMTRAGLHCAPLVHRTLGTYPHGSVRASLGVANTAADVDLLAAALDELASEARRTASAA